MNNWNWKYEVGDLVETHYDGSLGIVIDREWKQMGSEYEPDTDDEGPIYTIKFPDYNMEVFEYELNEVYE